ncbi:hypothetical protein BV20DRAFT_990286 [Pilatotrama ljubarskyi]|nr:hypothetical protein BV20DRAFT_990286 [Pilatotrama ljubarskyi]
MDVWPGYSDGQSTAPEKIKAKAKAKDERVEAPWRYPVLDHGALGAATLRKKERRYEWTFVRYGKSDYKLVPDDPVEVFPPTRPEPWRGPKATELQRAEQGARFLRTFYPDIDVQAELIRDEITEDTRLAQKLKHEDPYAGNMIAVISFHASRKNMAYIAVPMGETNCQLNMSPVVIHPRTKVDLKPVAAPVYAFDTPIRQIVASPHGEVGKGKPDPMLGVRTMGSTIFMQVKLAVNRAAFTVEPAPFLTAQRSDIGDRHAVDLAISPTNITVGYVVNDTGSIYRCTAPEGKKLIELIHTGDASKRSLYRIAASEVRETLLSVSDKSASLLDLRAGKRPHALHVVARPDVVLTSVESLSDDHLIRLVSSEEILWLDERNTKKPLLSVKHGREIDITLRAQTHVMISSPLTFLTSRRNSLITVYDVSRGSDNLVHLYDAPYALPPALRPDGPHLGYAFFQQATLSGSKSMSIFQLSERGSISLLNLQRLSKDVAQETPNSARRRVDWPPDVLKLKEDADAARSDLGPLAGKAHSIVDLQPAYQRLFVERKHEDLAAQTNVVFDTLERMPSFWQDTEVGIEHSLTTFDLAMRSGPEPVEASRNDWFTGSALDCAAGYRALVQGHLPHERLIQTARWHLDISSFIRCSAPELEEDPQKTLENLARYDLADGPDRTAPSFRQESEARSQLALDLALASDVFTHKRPGKNALTSFDEDMLNISRSTEAMSLGELEPPPVHFGFLRPIPKEDPLGESTPAAGTAEVAKAITPLGVRLLLQEWEVGTDPAQYTYHDPYDEKAEVPVRLQRPVKVPIVKEGQYTKGSGSPATIQTQRPPAIAPSVPKAPPTIVTASQPFLPRRPLIATRSQDVLATTPHVPPSGSQPADSSAAPPSSQQEFMASTQVLPGPHGGRPVPAKKKPVKKRLGGF